MAKKSALSRAVRGLRRALLTKDERTVDEALDNFEEAMEEHGEDSEPEIEVHNHVPDFRGMDDASRGTLPEKDPPGFDRSGHDSRDEAPPWFKKHEEATDARFKKMNDAMNEGFAKWAKQEEKEDEHQEDRRHDDRRDRRNDDDEEERENLEMEDRRHGDESEQEEHREEEERGEDRRHDDRRHDDRRDRRNNDRRDEANREILGELEYEAPPGTGDRARKARDSQYLEESFQDVLSKAEVLVPGIALPTFDKKASPIKTFRAIHGLRSKALDLAYHQTETRNVIDAAMGGRTMDSKRMSYGVTRTLFNSAATMVGASNNHRATDRRLSNSSARDNHQVSGGVQSIADLNKRNREHYKGGVH